MKAWKAILAAIVIFVAGLTSGALAAHLYRVKDRRAAAIAFPGTPPSPWMNQRLEFLRRLSDKMDLTAAQHEHIDRYLHETQQRLRELWEPVEPRAKEEMAALRKRIEGELTSAQREHFETLLKARTPRSPTTDATRRRRPDPTNSAFTPPSGAPAATAPERGRAAPPAQALPGPR